METWTTEFKTWEDTKDTLIQKLNQENPVNSEDVMKAALMLANSYDTCSVAVRKELNDLRLLGHKQITLLKHTDLQNLNRSIWGEIFRLVVTTASLDAIIYKKAQFSNGKFWMFGFIPSLGFVILTAILSENHNILNLFKLMLKLKKPAGISEFKMEALEFANFCFTNPRRVDGVVVSDVDALINFLNDDLPPVNFKIDFLDENVYDAQLQWQAGYIDFMKEENLVFRRTKDGKSDPVVGIEYAQRVQTLVNMKSPEINKILQNMCVKAKKQLRIMQTFPKEEFKCKAYIESSQIFFLAAPMFAMLHKFNEFPNVVVDNWGSVLCILVAKNETYFTHNIQRFMLGKFDYYPAQDMRYVIDEARNFNNKAKNSPDRLGFKEEELELFDLFVSTKVVL